MKPIIQVDSLSKSFRVYQNEPGFRNTVRGLFFRKYQDVQAVRDVSFNIEKGEIVGYLGRNGAGKSTTIKMMIGVLFPTSGHINVNGIIPWQERAKLAKQIGVVFGQRTSLWWDLPVAESFDILRYLYNLQKESYEATLKILRDLLEMDSFWLQPVRQLSLGQRMRAEIGAAFLHNPKILFLDEPTIRLDIIAKEQIRAFIKQINQKHETTVVLTTHDLNDVELLCNRIILIENGSLVFDDSLTALKVSYDKQRRISVHFAAVAEAPAIPMAELIDYHSNKAVYHFNPQTTSPQHIVQYLTDRFTITDFTIRELDLETILRHLFEQYR